MTTVKTSNGSSIKNAISHNSSFPVPLSEALFENDQNLDPEYLTPLQQEAVALIAAFKKRQDEIAYGSTLSSHVYFFLGQWKHSDTITNYTSVAVEMLTALTDKTFAEAVETKIGSHYKESLINLLKQTYHFMCDLQMPAINSLIEIQEVLNRDWIGREEWLQQTIDEYRDKLQVSYESKHIRF